jgi:exopolysaccharide biosynthesis polyprenyl glycosylphosphotransferase
MTKFWLNSMTSIFSSTMIWAAGQVGSLDTHFMGESLGLLVVLLSCQICFHLNGIDDLLVDSKPQVFLQKVLKSVGAGLVIASSLFYIFPKLSPSYAAIAASSCFLIFGLVVLRPIVRTVIHGSEDVGTVIIGAGNTARSLYEELGGGDGRIQVIPSTDLERLHNEKDLSRIVLADPQITENSSAVQALTDLKLRGVHVESVIQALERTSRKIWIDGASSDWLLYAPGFGPSRVYLGLKRCFDIVLSTIGLILTAPLMALTAVAIKLDSRGPALFAQERVGLFGNSFTVYKFRSMRQDAEQSTGPMWAREHDERITRVGAIMRKCRLDELPQLINVLRGEMSFIGPRPERPYFVDLLKSKLRHYDLRHYVKPGITGWAQVMYRYGASVEDSHQKLQYDLYYTKNISFGLDLLILLKTMKVVFSGEGR